MTRSSKKNVLILGASGAVAHTTLVYLKNHRHLLNNLVLLDQRAFKEDNFESLKELDATFVHLRLEEKNRKKFLALLKKEKIDIILDLSDAPTELMADMIFEYGDASYVCCAFCTESYAPLGEALNEWIDVQAKAKKPKKPHIFFTGMNPGNVNMWAAIGAQKFGKPLELTEFEYDTSRFMKHHKEKLVTWCVPEFVVELVTDPAEIILGDHKIKSMFPNGLYHTEDLEPLFSPIWKLPKYPKGCIVTHEECVTLGNRWNIPCRFIYTVNEATMNFIKKTYEEKGKIEDSDLMLGTNTKDPLLGSDNIALRLEYKDKAVYYFNSASNENLKECSGTDYQVSVGVFAALFTLLNDDLKKGGIYYPEDLLDTTFPKFLTDNMMIQEFVFEKNKEGKLTLLSHNPHISYGEGAFVKI
jgi:saccharopine dehydrogenase-like NADP-dependent oxidoreductase